MNKRIAKKLIKNILKTATPHTRMISKGTMYAWGSIGNLSISIPFNTIPGKRYGGPYSHAEDKTFECGIGICGTNIWGLGGRYGDPMAFVTIEEMAKAVSKYNR